MSIQTGIACLSCYPSLSITIIYPGRLIMADASQSAPRGTDAGIVERKGAGAVTREEQNTGFRQLFFVWVGFSVAIANFMVASQLASKASFSLAIAGVIIGWGFAGFFMAGGAAIGQREGILGTMAMRVPFGLNAKYLTAIPMIVACGGWFGVIAGISASAINEIIFALYGVRLPINVVYVIWSLVMGVIAVYGYKLVVWFQNITAPITLLLLLWVTYVLFTREDLFKLWQPPAGEGLTFMQVINIMPAAAPAMMMAAADTSRYVKTESIAKWTVFWTILIIASATGVLGVASALVTGTGDPAQILIGLDMGIPALLFLILVSWTMNCLNAYWGGLALTGVTTGFTKSGAGMPQQISTGIIVLLGAFLAVSGIYTSSGLTVFLVFLGATLAPANGILFTDYFIIRRKMERRVEWADLDRKNGAYWYTGGWHIPALIAWIISAGYASFLRDVTKLAPAITSFFMAGIIYYVLYRLWNKQGR